jgi:transcriptional antiterminator RfaH
MKAWYVLYTKPNAEYQVADAMCQRGFEIYLPEIDPVGKGRRCKKKRPFFPCYLFSRIDFETVSLSSVQWTPGLRRVVTCDGRPTSLADEIIDLIRSKLGEIEASGGYPLHPFKPGDLVRITDGPFRDMVAIFHGPSTPAQRVKVLLDILGPARPTQVEVTDLEKVSQDVAGPLPKRPRRTRGRGRRIDQGI